MPTKAIQGKTPPRRPKQRAFELIVVKRPQGQKGFMVLPKRWVVERSFGWMAHCRRLLRDFERVEGVLTGLHMIAFVGVMLHQVSQLLGNSS
jgi:transposase